MYIIKKQVHGNTYYWNNISETWEGLTDNAIPVDERTLDVLMTKFLRQHDGQDHSFTKVLTKVTGTNRKPISLDTHQCDLWVVNKNRS